MKYYVGSGFTSKFSLLSSSYEEENLLENKVIKPFVIALPSPYDYKETPVVRINHEIPFTNKTTKKDIFRHCLIILRDYTRNNKLIISDIKPQITRDIMKNTYLFSFHYLDVLETNNIELLFKYKNAQINA